MTTLDLDALQAAAEKHFHKELGWREGNRCVETHHGTIYCSDGDYEDDLETVHFLLMIQPKIILALIDRLRKAEAENQWQPIETAPKGGGAELVTDPEWVDPPCILLLFEGGKTIVGYWDWYFAEGGIGYDGGLAWVEPCSGERLHEHYDAPIAWMSLPALPTSADSEGAKG